MEKNERKLLGIDVGGTKTSVCIGDESGKILVSQRIVTDPQNGPDECIGRILELCKRVLVSADLKIDDICAVGIAAPGPLDTRTGSLHSPPNMPAWDNVPLRDMIAKGLGAIVAMNNDANAGALAEFYFGREKGTENLVYLTHSTGMGAGVIVNGKLLQGVTDTAGEVGHFVLVPNGPLCPCGLKGCFEVFCGGRSTANRLRTKIERDGVKTAILEKAGGKPENIDFKAFLSAALDGDSFALEEWNTYIRHLAHGIGIIIMTLNPEAIILGTIAVHAGAFLLDPLKNALVDYTWGVPGKACRISPSTLEGKTGDLGAIAIALGALS
ncbi:MAG: ROK family protein [Lentisphaerae bacterium]|nr:ROK family protein [Lentisphaerota bacterium]